MKEMQQLTSSDRKKFEPEAKIGLLATVNSEGLPHITLITTLRAKTPTQLMFGQFTEGQSKKHLGSNPRAAFLVMNRDRELWRGKTTWTHAVKKGEDFELYNNQPMFRYNAYFGVHTVHYLDLVNYQGRETFSVPKIVGGSIAAKGLKTLMRSERKETVLRPWAEARLNEMKTMKFLAYVRPDGFPWILPLVPSACVDSGRILILPSVCGTELSELQPDMPVALFALTMETESVLVRGRFSGFHRRLGLRTGTLDIDWVYNSLPPQPGQIYPPLPLEPKFQPSTLRSVS